MIATTIQAVSAPFPHWIWFLLIPGIILIALLLFVGWWATHHVDKRPQYEDDICEQDAMGRDEE